MEGYKFNSGSIFQMSCTMCQTLCETSDTDQKPREGTSSFMSRFIILSLFAISHPV